MKVGAGCVLGPNVTVAQGCVLGDGVLNVLSVYVCM